MSQQRWGWLCRWPPNKEWWSGEFFEGVFWAGSQNGMFWKFRAWIFGRRFFFSNKHGDVMFFFFFLNNYFLISSSLPWVSTYTPQKIRWNPKDAGFVYTHTWFCVSFSTPHNDFQVPVCLEDQTWKRQSQPNSIRTQSIGSSEIWVTYQVICHPKIVLLKSSESKGPPQCHPPQEIRPITKKGLSITIVPNWAPY